MHVQEQRTVHVYFLFYNYSVHFRSLKDDFTKIRTLARTLHEQALRNSTLRNSEFSDGIANIKIGTRRVHVSAKKLDSPFMFS
jgi:hypothetical protein